MPDINDVHSQMQNPSTVTLQAKFEQGMALHRQGRLADAESTYRDIIRQQPQHFGALHLLGLIALQTQHTERGFELIGMAIALKPDFAEAYSNRGLALRDLRRPEDAMADFNKAIALKPGFAVAHNNRGMVLCDLNCHTEALESYNKAITLKPDYAEAYNNRGMALWDLGRYAEALASYDEAIALKPDFVEAYSNRGNTLQNLRRHEEALASYNRAIALKSNYAEAHNNRGAALWDLRRHTEALKSYDRAIALKPDYAEACNNRGNALRDLTRYVDALANYDRAIALKPDYAGAHYNRGVALWDLRRYTEALESYDRAITLKPDYAEAYNNRGNVLLDLTRYIDALASYDRAIALKRDYAEAHYNRGVALWDLRRYKKALESYDRAIALKSDYAEAYNNRGNTLRELTRYEEALASYDRAIALKPEYLEAHYNRGNALDDLNRHTEAADSYTKVLKSDPEHPFTKGKILHQRMMSCDWKEVDRLIAEIDDDIALGKLSAEPFGWQAVAKSERSLQICAELYNKYRFPAAINFSTHNRLANSKKIRIGYSSGELREHATSHLIIGLLELHDKSRFEIYAVDNGWDDRSEIRRRIHASVHSIVDISQLSDQSAVAAIGENQIDILVNLNGYFGNERTRVFAQRPAPIQVNYLGFPGTLGASYMDYIIADQHVIPHNHMQFYAEKVVYLPDCYQANDGKKEIGTYIFSRAECGLPQTGFVFCCFNNNYKITPDVFDRWMRILNRVEDSVLWLLEGNAAAVSNLRKEATNHGVNAERLIFAKRMSSPDHLARHRLADLSLDTLPCNAHTTASDALWTGLPILTVLGTTFAGRVAASLLNAIGLPELITATLDAYEQTAVDLATHPEKMSAIKRKLVENRLTAPLFDTKHFTKHIEAAYNAMFERYHAGLPPDYIFI